MYLSQDPIGLAGNNPTLYGYVKDVNSWIDVYGLEIRDVNPFDINFSQRTVSEIRVFDATKYQPINVMDVGGQLVTYDNRRLLAAQNANLKSIKVNVIDPDALHPYSTTKKTWRQKFNERFNDKRNKNAGGVVPYMGLKTQPTCNQQ
jgi:uncharacterized protein RhaS with RHS repeats